MFARQRAQCVGKLNFATTAWLGAFEKIENFRRQNVAADDAQVRRGFVGFRFFNKIGDLAQAVAPFAFIGGTSINNAVEVNEFARNGFDGNRAQTGGFVDVAESARDGLRAIANYITEQDGEWFVADEFASDKHCVAETERIPLANIAEVNLGADVADQVGAPRIAFLAQKVFKLGRMVKMVFNGILAAAGDDDNVLDTGGGAFLDGVLNERLVDNWKHFLGLSLGGRKKASAESCCREDCFANAFGLVGHRIAGQKAGVPTYVPRRGLSIHGNHGEG